MSHATGVLTSMRVSTRFLAILLALAAGAASTASGEVVISQVYGGGGNSGAPLRHDFIELFNRGTTAVSLSGWSIQYASATGTGAFGASSTQITELPDVTLLPGQYFLIQEAAGGASGALLTAPDQVDPTAINMSGTGGKVALVRTNVTLGCNGSSLPCSSAQLALIEDLAAYGSTTNFFEGEAPAPSLSNTTAAFRAGDGCIDTNDNGDDFTPGAPAPRTTASPLRLCGVTATDPAATATVEPGIVVAGGSTLMTVTVTPGATPASTGLVARVDLATIGLDAEQPLFDDGTNGDAQAGDLVFSLLLAVPLTAPAGPALLPVTVSDAQSRAAATEVVLTVTAAPVSSPPVGVGAAAPSDVVITNTTLLTVDVRSGANPADLAFTVVADLTAIGGTGAQPFFDDGTHGDAAAGDFRFSFLATVGEVAGGPRHVPFSVSDALGRASGGTLALTIVGCDVRRTIAEIQGTGATSPWVMTTQTVRGVVTAVRADGFYVQMPPPGDGDPATSDGMLVFTGAGRVPASIAVGVDACVTGRVVEFRPGPAGTPTITEFSSPLTIAAIGADRLVPEPTPITAETVTGPPEQVRSRLEALEGMRVGLAAMTVVAPTLGSVDETAATAASTGVFYGVPEGTRRPFREAGVDPYAAPLSCAAGADCVVPVFDGNPERIRVNTKALGSGVGIDLAAGATISGIAGPLDFGFNAYTLLPEPGFVVSAQPVFTPVGPARAGEVTIGSWNMQRFYDTVDDAGVDDAVLTPAAFTARLEKASLTIRQVLGMPDVLAVVEVENLSTLRAVAAKVNADAAAVGGVSPGYEAHLVEGNDVGGIDVGFLVKASVVRVLGVEQVGKDATFVNPATGADELLNDRPPLVLRGKVHRPQGGRFTFTVVAIHLRSLNDVELDSAAGQRVRAKRNAQAEFLAAVVQDLQAQDGDEPILLVGDFNAFQVNDGYVDVMSTILGRPTAPQQVVVAGDDLVTPDLVNLIDGVPASERYTFVFDGNAQAIDHAVASASLLPWVSRVAFGRSNADFPDAFRNDASRPERASDHDGIVTFLALGQARLRARVLSRGTYAGGAYLDLEVSNVGDGNALDVRIEHLQVFSRARFGLARLAGPSLPIPFDHLLPGQAKTARIHVRTPAKHDKLWIVVYGTYLRPGGGRRWFGVPVWIHD